jgi:hypothetical protein
MNSEKNLPSIALIPMLQEIYQNVIPQSIIDKIIADYEARSSYETSTMNKADPGLSLSLVQPICEEVIGKKLEYRSGNFYKHSQPYLPHTDFRVAQGNEINIVIPLQYWGEQASLVVFDQLWDNDSVTWCLTHDIIHFAVNTGVHGRPCDYDLVGNTYQPIDDQFHKDYLSHYPKDCFFGLSGKAYKFQPGNIIVFDNRLVHCTSRFKGTKLGLSLRFSGK